MSEKYYSRLAVDLTLSEGQKVLLQYRINKQYMNNIYGPACGGHVEKGESFTKTIIREAKEEIGIKIKKEDLKLLAVNHDYEQDHVQLFFTSSDYEGEPTVCEPDQCGGLLWADIDSLPENIIPYVKNVLECIKNGILYDDGKFSFLENYLSDKIQEDSAI